MPETQTVQEVPFKHPEAESRPRLLTYVEGLQGFGMAWAAWYLRFQESKITLARRVTQEQAMVGGPITTPSWPRDAIVYTLGWIPWGSSARWIVDNAWSLVVVCPPAIPWPEEALARLESIRLACEEEGKARLTIHAPEATSMVEAAYQHFGAGQIKPIILHALDWAATTGEWNDPLARVYRALEAWKPTFVLWREYEHQLRDDYLPQL